MAKSKAKVPRQPSANKPSSRELADFIAELKDEKAAEDSTEPIGETAADEEETELSVRKVPVTKEKGGRRRKPKVETVPDDHLDEVFTAQPPEAMQRLTKSRASGWPWGWIVTGLAVLAAASLTGFFVFTKSKKFTGTNVQLQFQPVGDVASGATVTLTIEYQNLEPVDLTKGELTVEYPEGFTYSGATPQPTNDFHNDFSIGTIRSGRAGRVSITGTLIGSVGTSREFRATLTYRPSTFNSDFQQKTSTTVKITSSILSVQVAGPTQLAPGASATWTVAYKNTADRDLPNVQIEAVYPEGLTVAKTDPPAQERSALWRISKVSTGASGTINITATANGAVGDSLPLVIRTGVLGRDNAVDLQDEQTILIILVKTGVSTTIAVNGSTDPVSIDPGETLNYSIHVANTSDAELANLTITAGLDGSAMKPETLSSDSRGVVKNTTVTWTKDQAPALAALKPGQDLTLTFSLGTRSPLTAPTDGDRNQRITTTVSIGSPTLGTNTNQARTPSTVAVTKINTVMKLTAEARYYDIQGQPVGSGPVPPTVGRTTTYHLSWAVANATNDASGLTVSATLPTTVLWTGQNVARDAGDIAFDPATRTVRWTLNTVPAGTGSRWPALTAGFDVSITPTADQAGTVPVLLNDSTAAATDSFTGHALTATAPTLATDVPTDAQAGGQGKVQAS